MASINCRTLGHTLQKYHLKVPRDITRIHFAAYSGAGNLLLAYINADPASVNKRDSFGYTPLAWAAERDNEYAVEVLLASAGTNVDLINYEGKAPVLLAASQGHTSIVERLLRHGASANLRDLRRGSPLYYAAAEGHADIIRLLLASGVSSMNLNMQYGDDVRDTPLSVSARRGYLGAVELLLGQKDIDPYIGGKELVGRFVSPLGLALRQQYREVAELILLKAGPDPDPESDHSKEKILIDVADLCNEKMVRLLLTQYGVDPNYITELGSSAISSATNWEHEGIVRFLFEFRPAQSTEAMSRALLVAASRDRAAIIELLLAEQNIDVNCKNEDGRTPLALATENGHETVMALLLADERVDPDCRDTGGRTPLLLAAGCDAKSWHKHDYMGVARQLLVTGRVDPNARDSHRQQTPLYYAVANKRSNLI